MCFSLCDTFDSHVTCLFVSGQGSLGSPRISDRWIIHNPNPFYEMTRVVFLTSGVKWMLLSYTTGRPSVALSADSTTLASTHTALVSPAQPLVLFWNNLLKGHRRLWMHFVLVPSCFKAHHDPEVPLEAHVFSGMYEKKTLKWLQEHNLNSKPWNGVEQEVN